MIAKYYQYDQTIEVIEDFIKMVHEIRYPYYASELLMKLVNTGNFNLEMAIRKASAICRLAGIPVQDHFRHIFRCEEHALTRDWKLSEFACSLIILSYDSIDEEVKEIQYSLIRYLGLS